MGKKRQVGKSRQKPRRQPQSNSSQSNSNQSNSNQANPGRTRQASRQPATTRPGPSQRYPGRKPNGGREMPQRTPAQTARLWIISLCGAVPGAIVVYLANNFFAGAAVFLAIVMVLGFGVYQYEKRKKQ